MFDFNIFTTEFEEKNRQNQMRIPKLISSVGNNRKVLCLKLEQKYGCDRNLF